MAGAEGTDLFKLFFEHDLRMEQLTDNYDARGETKRSSTLEEFMKPVQTYSKFYFSGSRLVNGDVSFGFTSLKSAEKLFKLFVEALDLHSLIADSEGNSYTKGLSFSFANEASKTIILNPTENSRKASAALLSQNGGADLEKIFNSSYSVREKILYMKPFLDAGSYVLYTEQAHNGTDLHLFCRENIYEKFFQVFKPLTGTEEFRFFSINGKRSKSERLFYFETWSLNSPPHGFEEVLPQTVLR